MTNSILVDATLNTIECEQITTTYGVAVTKLLNIFIIEEFRQIQINLSSILEQFISQHKTDLECQKLIEIMVFGNKGRMWNDLSDTQYIDCFDAIDISTDHKIIDHAKFTKLLIAKNLNGNFIPYETELHETLSKPIIHVIELLAKQKRLVGTKRFRTNVKVFIHWPKNNEEINKEYKLKWHYDDSAETTVAIELLNELTETSNVHSSQSVFHHVNDDTGKLLFANNRHTGKCIGSIHAKGGSIITKKFMRPITESIVSVDYPKNGALMFDGKQGKQLHCPSNIIISKELADKVLIRVLLQVVLYDDEWMRG